MKFPPTSKQQLQEQAFCLQVSRSTNVILSMQDATVYKYAML